MRLNKGFTLIELLAVIVILAIIALVAVPIILNVVETARKGAKESSTLGYIDAVEKQVMISLTKGNPIEPDTYTVEQLTDLGVNVKGDKPSKDSYFTIDKKGRVTEGWVTYEESDYKIYYDGKDAVANKEKYIDKKGDEHPLESGSSTEVDSSVVVYSAASSGITQESEGVADYNDLNRLTFVKYTFLDGAITKREACVIIGNDTGKLFCLDPNGISNHEEYENQFGNSDCEMVFGYGSSAPEPDELSCHADFTRSGESFTTNARIEYDGRAFVNTYSNSTSSSTCTVDSNGSVDCW